MRLPSLSRLCSAFICVPAWLSFVPLSLHAQCTDSTTYELLTAATVRLNGNDVRGYAEHAIYGNYRYYWQMWLQSWFYQNGSVIGSYPNGYASPLGATAYQQYDATLSYWGPGNYSVTGKDSSYSPYCNIWEPPWSNGASPWIYSNTTTVVRPARPDYGSAGHPVFYLGPGVSYDQARSASTSLVAGNPNGAPETPQWVFTLGSQFGNLSCTQCNQPVFTATRRSTGCLTYDVELQTSYNGFLCDPFWMFINAPNNTVAANCPLTEGCPSNTWNWTRALGNGWQSWDLLLDRFPMLIRWAIVGL